jgi:hypothetical protein
MSYIDSDQIVLKENEVLNQLLICLICTGILISPKECSKCQRAFCEACLKKLKPRRCGVCKNTVFVNAHIQTKYYLEALKFKTICCDTIIDYNQHKSHIEECPNTVLCKECNTKYIKEEEHNCPVVLARQLEENNNNAQLARRNTVGIDGIDTGREIFVHSGLVLPGKCKVCRERDHKFPCYICEKDVCEVCAPISVIFKIDRIRKYAREQFTDYASGFKCSTFFVIYSCYEEGLAECNYGAVITIYIFMGLLFDIFMATLIGVIYIIIIPLLYFLFFIVFSIFYILLYVPFTYFYWVICLNRRRACIKC